MALKFNQLTDVTAVNNAFTRQLNVGGGSPFIDGLEFIITGYQYVTLEGSDKPLLQFTTNVKHPLFCSQLLRSRIDKDGATYKPEGTFNKELFGLMANGKIKTEKELIIAILKLEIRVKKFLKISKRTFWTYSYEGQLKAGSVIDLNWSERGIEQTILDNLSNLVNTLEGTQITI